MELIEEVTEYLNQGLAKYPIDYFRNVRKLIPSEVDRRINFISKCQKYYKVSMQYVMRLKKKCAKGSAQTRKGVITQSSPLHEIETEL